MDDMSLNLFALPSFQPLKSCPLDSDSFPPASQIPTPLKLKVLFISGIEAFISSEA